MPLVSIIHIAMQTDFSSQSLSPIFFQGPEKWRIDLRWLKAVSSTFQDLDFDVSL